MLEDWMLQINEKKKQKNLSAFFIAPFMALFS